MTTSKTKRLHPWQQEARNYRLARGLEPKNLKKTLDERKQVVGECKPRRKRP
jgi:hypothetical protein